MWGLTLQTHKPKLAKIIGQNVIQSILKERNPLRFIRARHPRLALGLNPPNLRSVLLKKPPSLPFGRRARLLVVFFVKESI